MSGGRAWVISVGDELLNGRTVDTNSGWLQRRLAAFGVGVDGVLVVPDRAERIAAALDACPEGVLVILTGGLGPTHDDLTAEAAADWAGLPLSEDTAVTAHLRALCAAHGWTYRENMIKQSLRPEGFAALINPQGTAPAMTGEARGRHLVLLPGVPSEIHALWPLVEAHLSGTGRLGQRRPSVLLRTVRISEPGLGRATEDLRAAHPELDWSWWLTRWGVDVQAVAREPGAELPSDLQTRLARELGDHVYARDLRELPEVVQEALIDAALTVAVAESCTGGLLGAALTETPGSSACVLGGAITYADRIKREILGVSADTLAAHGAVSVETAREMAAGCRERWGADLGVSITGVAGPDGGSDEKPVGTVCLGLAAADGVYAARVRLGAHRLRNRELSVAFALDALRRRVLRGGDPLAGDGAGLRR